MGHLPNLIDPERADTPGARRYRELIAQSRSARARGEHWTAQQLASEAHKWAMEELVRLQHLAYAQQALERVTKQLNDAWDRDRSCATLDELRERHPEFKRLIASWETAEQRARELNHAEPGETATSDQVAPEMPGAHER